MNPRIELVNDKEVRIRRQLTSDHPSHLTIMHLGADLVIRPLLDDGRTSWDAEGRAALRDAINCLDATGSFAALADTSAVPFVGKRMLERGPINQGPQLCDIIHISGDYIHYCNVAGGVGHMIAHNFLPLTAPAKYRPFTPVEAAAHLGRELEWRNRYYYLAMVGECDIRLSADDDGYVRHFPYAEFVSSAIWRDDQTPCGVQESTP